MYAEYIYSFLVACSDWFKKYVFILVNDILRKYKSSSDLIARMSECKRE